MMPSFETPPLAPFPESAETKKRYEAFLSKDRRHVNLYLSWIFRFIDEKKEEGLIDDSSDEIDAAKAASNKELAFLSRYGVNVLESYLDAQEEKMPEVGRKEFLDEYKQFCDVLAQPELRPRLLSKMCFMDPDDPWDQRQAFTRFLYEFYGREKVIHIADNGEKEGFLTLEGQADLVEAWNLKGEWGFTEEDFMNVRKQIPDVRERMKEYVKEPYVAPVLTPSLPEKYGMSGERRTFEELWRLAATAQRSSTRREWIRTEPELFQLHNGFPHQPGLAFEIISFVTSAESKDDRSKPPQAAILAAAAEHPEWIRSMRSKSPSSINMDGYDIKRVIRDAWERPYLHYEEHGVLRLEPSVRLYEQQ